MNTNQKFAALAIGLQFAIVLIFGLCGEYSGILDAKNDTAGLEGAGTRYAFYQDIHVMMFIGFGYLMTFLRKYTYGAVGWNFMVAAFAIQWTILCNGFWHCVHKGVWKNVALDVMALVHADFGAAAVLITFGAVLGKVNAFQLLTIAFIEIFFYSLNGMIHVEKIRIADIGGSLAIHAFGAYFGLACAWMLGPKEAQGHKNNTTNKTSDTFAMIGTLFLWMFWPSFNGALADGSRQHRVVINTVFALAASCISAFCFSTLLRHDLRFNMIDIQNASLAGGVALGASADMMMRPYGALCLGFAAGFLSVFGYTRIQAYLENKIGLFDTCGVNNLHGMPGLLGGFCSVIAAAVATDSVYGNGIGVVFPERAPSDPTLAELYGVTPGSDRSASSQALMQLAAIAITIAIAIPTGLLTGFIVKQPFFGPPPDLFTDSIYWEVPEEDTHHDATVAHDIMT
eukprot:c19405_g1_i2.p1 GENE.c19405_g1_i2~~c19405_g1_i2.p1  ORF type:complete len:455 (-),score=206.01 c19405_g1_i2:40-1404(-)